MTDIIKMEGFEFDWIKDITANPEMGQLLGDDIKKFIFGGNSTFTVINTETNGLTEEIVPAADHFILEINHFNMVVKNNLSPKLTNNDSLWNSKTLEAIQKSILCDKWVNL